MAIEIEPYLPHRIKAVHTFNQRLQAQGSLYCLDEDPVPFYATTGDSRLYQEYYLAVEGDEVRGGYQLKHGDVTLGGRIVRAAALQRLVSESAVDRRYTLVAIRLVQDALRRVPLLYALGLGGADEPITRMLKGLGWTVWPVPFHLKVLHPVRFLRNLPSLRTRRLRRLLAGGAVNSGTPAEYDPTIEILRRLLTGRAVHSGVEWAGTRIANAWARRKVPRRAVAVEQVDSVSSWGDELWAICKDKYALAGVRDGRWLEVLYPGADRRFTTLRVLEGGRVIGWVVLFTNATSGHDYLGDMRIGSIVDCLALPEDAGPVMRAATEVLEQRGVDVILTNQSHPAWCAALADAGFVSGPSTFMFGMSKTLAAELGEPPDARGIHMNRADGAGGIMDPELWGDRPIRHLTPAEIEAQSLVAPPPAGTVTPSLPR